MILKKYFIILLLLILSFGKTFAYTSDDYFNIHYAGNPSRTDLYVIPNGKDLIITNIYIDAKDTAELYIRDNGGVNLGGGSFDVAENPVFIVFKDIMQVRDSASTNNFIFQGILVNEGEDIQNLLNKTEYGINKPIFNEEFIKEIYLYEGVIMLFLLLFKFFARLLGKRKTRAGL